MPDARKILILGGTGFIGDYLLPLLIMPENKLAIIHIGHIDKKTAIPGVEYWQCDLSNPDEMAVKLIKTAEMLIYLVRPDRDAIILQNILKILGPESALKKIVYASTILLYPDNPTPQSENTPKAPLTDYEIQKNNEEDLLIKFAENTGTKLVIARLANVYGSAKNTGIIGIIFSASQNGKTVIINGDGTQIRGYIHVKDASNLLSEVINHEDAETVAIYNISAGAGRTINEVINQIEQVSDKKIVVAHGPAIGEKRCVIGDNKKILSTFQYKLIFDFKKGLEQTYANFQE
ncbi:NAD-dependent epimerase/dehydratase family protein [bacterium]|nr:MAG: NAD-dependent epimerase/dehydratase family protein [bacterium]